VDEASVGVWCGADEFIFRRCPFSKSQFRLIDAEGSAFLPDRAKGAAGELN